MLDGILRPSPPPCVHRFTRYLDIQLASIGALRWRGNLPPNGVPVSRWEAYLGAARKALARWAQGQLPADPRAGVWHVALGEPDARKVAVVQDFLLAEERGEGCGWDWLEAVSDNRGARARAMFS